MFRVGSIVLGTLPQADGRYKDRPLLLLARMPQFDDWLVCGISSKLRSAQQDFDEILEPSDPDFKGAGLTVPSVIRTGFVGVLPEKDFPGILGGIQPARAKGILARLVTYLAEQVNPD